MATGNFLQELVQTSWSKPARRASFNYDSRQPGCTLISESALDNRCECNKFVAVPERQFTKLADSATFFARMQFDSVQLILLFNLNSHFYLFLPINFAQKRVGNVDTVQGLQAVRYQFEEHALDNGIHNKANKCFCRNGEFSTLRNVKHFSLLSPPPSDCLRRAAILASAILYWLSCVQTICRAARISCF